jgi:hypothetical protein
MNCKPMYPRALYAAFVAAMLALPASSIAATVSGSLQDANGAPLPNTQIHFEDRVDHDLFLLETGADGGFATDLPPGVYDLRGDRGTVIARGIAVENADVALGSVREPGLFAGLRIFDRQGVTRGMITTPAPGTANIPDIEQSAQEEGSQPPPPSPAPPAQTSSTALPSQTSSAAPGK